MRGCTITTFVIVLLVSALTAAAPQPNLKRKSKGIAMPLTKRSSSILLHPDNTVNFSAVEAHAASVSAKIVRGLENYEKNTGTTHPSALERKGHRKRDGKLALTKFHDIFWHGTLSIGSPPVEFDVELDTGCADLFVETADEDEITQEDIDTLWNPSSSSTAIDLNREFNIEFANRDYATGKQYTDNVTVAGLTAEKQTIGAASIFRFMGTYEPPVDGILGLAFQSISEFPASSLLETLVSENKVLPDPVFSFQLSSSGGELFIGGTNEALYQKDTFAYSDVTEQGYWQIEMDEIQSNGKTIANKVNVVIDTGSNYIFGNKDKVLELHQALGGKPIRVRPGFYSLPCQANPEPSVTFIFEGKPFTIPIQMLRLGPISRGSSDCLSTIITQTAPLSTWTIGSPFLQSVYTVFDYGTGPQPTPRVGFAKLA